MIAVNHRFGEEESSVPTGTAHVADGPSQQVHCQLGEELGGNT
jgi:hypothetical protein